MRTKSVDNTTMKLLVFLAQRFRKRRSTYRRVKTYPDVPSDYLEYHQGALIESWNSFNVAKSIVYHGESIAPAVYKPKSILAIHEMDVSTCDSI
jgi:hypothetical protein